MGKRRAEDDAPSSKRQSFASADQGQGSVSRTSIFAARLKALNQQFLRWVQDQGAANMDVLWSAGLKDYITYGDALVHEFKDLLEEHAAGVPLSTAGKLGAPTSTVTTTSETYQPLFASGTHSTGVAFSWAKPQATGVAGSSSDAGNGQQSTATQPASWLLASSNSAPVADQLPNRMAGTSGTPSVTFAAPPASSPAPSPSLSFTFGAPPASAASSPAPITFAAPSSTPGAAPAAPLFGAPPPTSTTATPSPITFGAPPPSSSPSAPLFAFNAPASTGPSPTSPAPFSFGAPSPSPSPAPSFTFGAPPASSTPAAPTTFGAPPPSSAAASTPGFMFSASATPGTSPSMFGSAPAAAGSAPMFGALGTGFQAPASAASPAPVTSFGAPPSSTAPMLVKPVFNFGVAPALDAGAGGSSAAADGAAAPKPLFSFAPPVTTGAGLPPLNFAAPVQPDGGDGEGGDGQPDEDEKKSFTPAIQVNESEAQVLFNSKSKISRLDKGADGSQIWSVLGMGILTVRQPAQPGKSPFLAFTTESGKVLLTAALYKGITCNMLPTNLDEEGKPKGRIGVVMRVPLPPPEPEEGGEPVGKAEMRTIQVVFGKVETAERLKAVVEGQAAA